MRVVGWDADRDVLLAARQGEPSFRWVQDLGDAYLAAAERGVALSNVRIVDG